MEAEHADPMPRTVYFGIEHTERLPGRGGDLLIHVRALPLKGKLTLSDVWKLSDNTQILLTNRHQDLPDWFKMHPLETGGTALGWMKQLLEAGYEPPEDPMEGPGIWRLCSGDKLVWLHHTRNADQMTIYEIGACGLLVRASTGDSEDLPFLSDGIDQPDDATDLKRVQDCWGQISLLPASRTFSDTWLFGS